MHLRLHRRVLAGALLALLPTIVVACGSSDDTSTGAPPASAAAAGTTGTTRVLETPTSIAPAVPLTAAPGTGTSAPASSTTTAAKGSTTTSTAGGDPGALPQTDEKPTASGPVWDADVASLWAAIRDDDPAAARGFFFPLSAYRQVKAISDIDGDYQNRLLKYYDEDIHALHEQLGTATDATLVGLEVGGAPQWIKPGVEYNKGAYWRVFDSKLVYQVGDKKKSMLVKSMISWRGRWYVVHLSSIR